MPFRIDSNFLEDRLLVEIGDRWELGERPEKLRTAIPDGLRDVLVRREEILLAAGESAWPDAPASARYKFAHALYQQVIYQRLSPPNRRRLHQAIGKALEVAYAGISSELLESNVAGDAA